MKKALLWATSILIGLILLLAVAVRLTTFHPPELQDEPVYCAEDAPQLVAGQALTVMTWNVQYMAGKDYVFWYDVPDGSGRDERPSAEAISRTFGELARVIRDENPDLVLLQEVDDGSKHTDGEDQLARLLLLLPDEYACHTSAFYWKALFVPHPRIMGSVGMKLSTLSKYRIDTAMRHQLAVIPSDPFTRQFNFRRALLEARLPVSGGGEFVALNTHLDAFARGTDTMARQIAQLDAQLRELTSAGLQWVLGGDFNLMPPGSSQYARLPESQRVYYEAESELAVLYRRYQAVPSLADVNGPNGAAWYTHSPNDPAVAGPALTLDYLFSSDGITVSASRVRRHDTLQISDHLPVIADITLP